MTDARLQALERRWRETGASEDGAAWLQERLRSGQLDEHRIQLAAYAGHPAAAALYPSQVSPDLAAHARGYAVWGVVLCTRLGLALVEACGGRWEGTPGRVLSAVSGWVAQPDLERGQAVEWAVQAQKEEERCPVSVPPTVRDYDLSPYEPQLARWRELLAEPGRTDAPLLASLLRDHEQGLPALTQNVASRMGDEAARRTLDAAAADWAFDTDQGGAPEDMLDAYCGDELAWSRLGKPPLDRDITDPQGWLRGLRQYEGGLRRAVVCAASAAALRRQLLLPPFAGALLDEVRAHLVKGCSRIAPRLDELRQGLAAHLTLCPLLEDRAWRSVAELDRAALASLVEALRRSLAGEDPIEAAAAVVAWSPVARGGEEWVHTVRSATPRSREWQAPTLDPQLLQAEATSNDAVLRRLEERLHDGSLTEAELQVAASLGYPAPPQEGEPLPSPGTALMAWCQAVAERSPRLGAVLGLGAIAGAARLLDQAPARGFVRTLEATRGVLRGLEGCSRDELLREAEWAIGQGTNRASGRLLLGVGACAKFVGEGSRETKLIAHACNQARRIVDPRGVLASAGAAVLAEALGLPPQPRRAKVRLVPPPVST